MEDNYLVHDMAKVEEMIKMLDEKSVDDVVKPIPEKVELVVGGKWVRVEEAEVMTVQMSCGCCCKFNVHTMSGSLMGSNCPARWPQTLSR